MWAKSLFDLAVQQLEADKDVVKTNIPYSEKHGDKKQAGLQRREVKSFDAAIDMLKNMPKWWKTNANT